MNIPATSWLAAALVFLAVTFGTVGLALLIEFTQESRRRRNMMRQLEGIGALDRVESGGLLRGRNANQPAWLQQLAATTPRIRDLSLLLQQAGTSTTVEALLLMCVGLSIGFGAALLILTRFLPFAIMAAAFGAYLPIWYLKRKRQRRIDAFESSLPDAIDLLGRAIRAGHPLSAGFRMVAEELKDPISTEFQRTFEEQRFGLPFDDAIIAMADRVALIDVRILVTAILIQREVGGNLAEVLDNLASVIRARFTIRRQLRVYTAQGRFSGYTLAVLPIIVGFLIYALNPDYMKLLFTHPIGKLLVLIATLMQITGFLWIRKIIDIEI
ncbi:MAG TPA: type II secretion system F family protein [Gemmatimonadales bacterium]|nr:type II secretion system F family protein [Gemmatimonadales bacterium]